MSIIQEALKKAQNYIESQRPSQKDKPEQGIRLEKQVTQKQATMPKSKTFKAKPILFIVFIVLTLSAVKQFLFKEKTFTIKPSLKDMTSHQEITYKPIAPKMEPEPRTKPMPLLKKAYEAKFTLNGIMFLNDGPQAIINNSVVREGDAISGAKVVRINKNNVILNLDDLEITLNLKR